MAKPAPELLQRARRYYDLEPRGDAGRLGDITLIAARGSQIIPALVRDSVREERATRHWFAHRQGGWTPIDIVLRSPLHETETWYDPRGQKKPDYGFGPSFASRVDSGSLLNADYSEIEKRMLIRLTPQRG